MCGAGPSARALAPTPTRRRRLTVTRRARYGFSMPSEMDAPGVSARPQRCSPLILSFLAFCVIGFGVWVVSAGKRYRQEYAQATPAWHVGSTQLVELSLGAEDARNLACASDAVVAGLKCGSDQHEGAPPAPDDPRILQPYNTSANQLLLGAGLWTFPDLKGPLPAGRFSAVCNYHIDGVMKTAAVRFDRNAPFTPLGTTVTVGRLTDCVIPQ
jgi:hypothetical protein